MPRLMQTGVVVVLIAVTALPARAAGPLVDAAWVTANAAKPDIVVLDARSDPKAYAAGHIPGAVFTSYGGDGWRVKKGDVVGMLPETPALEKLIGGLGIGNGDHVVVVAPGNSATDMGIATRIYWTFKVMGHDKVSVLDGGMKRYVADGHPVSTDFVSRRRPYRKSTGCQPTIHPTRNHRHHHSISSQESRPDHRCVTQGGATDPGRNPWHRTSVLDRDSFSRNQHGQYLRPTSPRCRLGNSMGHLL